MYQRYVLAILEILQNELNKILYMFSFLIYFYSSTSLLPDFLVISFWDIRVSTDLVKRKKRSWKRI